MTQADSSEDAVPFTITAAAVDAVAALGGVLCVGLEAGGCCGTTWRFWLPESEPPPDDGQRFRVEGATWWVSASALEMLRGAVLDHGARIRPPRFRVLRNPNTPEVCPCRRSFGVPWPGPGSPQCRSYQPMPWDGAFEPPAAWRRQTRWTRPD